MCCSYLFFPLQRRGRCEAAAKDYVKGYHWVQVLTEFSAEYYIARCNMLKPVLNAATGQGLASREIEALGQAASSYSQVVKSLPMT